MKQLILITAIATAAQAAPLANPLENLTLEQALNLAERRHPELTEARALIEAAEGRARQAGRFPNPEAIGRVESAPLEDRADGDAEYLAGVSQTVPLGGRLGKERQAEQLERDRRARELEVTRRSLRKRVHSAFATALYQERAFQAQQEIVQDLEKLVTVTQARVEAGDLAPGDLARAEIELARARVERKRSESMREQSLTALSAAIGDTSLVVKSLAGSLDETFEIPALESLAANLSEQPRVALAEADLRVKTARIDVARAERIPDVKVEALYHRLESSNANTFDIGLSIPLPLFNRNQGKLREARAEAVAAEARLRMTQNELNLRLRESYSALSAALANSRALKDEILIRAEAILKSAEARYAAGDISLSEVLPVRRDWAAIQLSYLESLRDVMQAWAAVASLTGLK